MKGLFLAACVWLAAVAIAFGGNPSVAIPGPGLSTSAITKLLVFSGHETNSTGCTSPCTSASYNTGTATSDRRVHAAIFAQGAGINFTSATICGSAATTNKSQNGGNSVVALVTLNVTTGTSCTVVATYSTNPGRWGIAVWHSTGLSSDAASSTNSFAGCQTNCNLTVTATTGGFTLAAASSNGAETYVWQIATAEYSDTCTGSACTFSSADVSAQGAGSAAVKVSGSSTANNGVSAAF